MKQDLVNADNRVVQSGLVDRSCMHIRRMDRKAWIKH